MPTPPGLFTTCKQTRWHFNEKSVGEKKRVIFGSSRSEEKTSTTRELQNWLEITTVFQWEVTWVFPKIWGTPPKWMVYFMENPIKHGMIWGENPFFWKHSHVHSLVYCCSFQTCDLFFPILVGGWCYIIPPPVHCKNPIKTPHQTRSPFLFFCLRQS